MLRSVVLAMPCLVLSIASTVSAADRQEHFEYWAKFVGNWQLENQSLELKVTRSDSGASFIFDTSSITFVHGWDPAEGKMKTLSFYGDGSHGSGHATIENGDMVGRSLTTNPDGTSRDATWRITRRSDSQFEFTTGNDQFVFNRRE